MRTFWASYARNIRVRLPERTRPRAGVDGAGGQGLGMATVEMAADLPEDIVARLVVEEPVRNRSGFRSGVHGGATKTCDSNGLSNGDRFCVTSLEGESSR